MTIIAALTRSHVIGIDDAMPWHIPEEYAHFLSVIKDKTVIMGRTSFASFGSTLTSSHTIVVSRRENILPNAIVIRSIKEAIEVAQSYGKEIYIAGGAEIYEQIMPFADRMLLSYINGEYVGNKFFPQIGHEWKVLQRENRGKYELVEYCKSVRI